jgi:uncharacterized protein (TIGR03083 family)
VITAMMDDIAAERAAVVDSLSALGPSARTACGAWTALDLAAHLVSEERLGGVLTFLGRSLAARGLSPAASPNAVESFIRRERGHGFEALIDRLRRPTPALLLRPQMAPVTLFEYWTHHDDLARPNGLTHDVPGTLAEVIPSLLRYQAKQMPSDVRVTLCAGDCNQSWSTGPRSAPEVTLDGTSADLVRWLAGRCPLTELQTTGPDAQIRALRAFTGRV